MVRLLAVILVLAAVLPGVAHAQTQPEQAARPLARALVSLEIGFAHVSYEPSALAPWSEWGTSAILDGAWRPLSSLELRLRLPASFAHTTLEGGKSTIASGNPFVGVAYVARGGTVAGSVGGGITAPVARASADVAQRTALALAAEMRGLRDLWLWYEESMAFVIDGELRYAPHPWTLRLASAIAYLADLTDDGPPPEVGPPSPSTGPAPDVITRARPDRIVTQHLVEGALDVGEHVHLGLAFAAFIYATNPPTSPDGTSDAAQLSTDAFVAWHPAPARLEARFTVNFDPPNGFTDVHGPIWSARLIAGVEF
jgi:hypothetical protein